MGKKKSEPKMVFLKVVTSRIYAFEEGHINGWSPERVIEDWFYDFPLETHHAGREGNRLGNTTLLVGAEELTEEQFKDYAKDIDRDANERIAKEVEGKRQREKEYERALDRIMPNWREEV